MDRVEFKGRQLNVELSGNRPKNSNHKNGKDTTKLHVSGSCSILMFYLKIVLFCRYWNECRYWSVERDIQV